MRTLDIYRADTGTAHIVHSHPLLLTGNKPTYADFMGQRTLMLPDVEVQGCEAIRVRVAVKDVRATWYAQVVLWSCCKSVADCFTSSASCKLQKLMPQANRYVCAMGDNSLLLTCPPIIWPWLYAAAVSRKLKLLAYAVTLYNKTLQLALGLCACRLQGTYFVLQILYMKHDCSSLHLYLPCMLAGADAAHCRSVV